MSEIHFLVNNISLFSTSNVLPTNLGNLENKQDHIDDNGEQTKASSDNDKLSMNQFQCKVCYKRYKYQRDLNRHERYYCGQEGQFACNFCDYRAKVRHQLHSHINSVHIDDKLNMNLFQCNICYRTYKYQRGLSRHEKYYCGQEGQFPCHICNYRANVKHHLQAHINRAHTAIENIYRCEVCDKTYKEKANLDSHKKYYCSKEPKYACNICDYRAKRKYTIESHINSVHADMKIKNFKCEACEKTYKYKRGLVRHQKYECAQEGLFKCYICNYRAKEKEQIKMHIINSSHNITDKDKLIRKSYQCKVCHKTYKHQTTFITHRKYYCSQEGNFPCNFCNYRAKEKWILKVHINKAHLGDGNMPKYKCGFCDKAYISKDNLTEHQKYHCDQEGRFPCNICNYRAKRKEYLKKHCLKIHTGEKDRKIKKFKCEACENTYTYKRGLIRHQKYDCGQRGQYVCYICNYKAKEKRQLEVHINKWNHIITGDEVDKLIEDIKLSDYKNIEIKQEQSDGDAEQVDSNSGRYTIVNETNDDLTSECSEILLPLEITITEIKQEIKESYCISEDKEASLPSTNNIELPNFENIEIKLEPIDNNTEQVESYSGVN